MRKLLLWTFLAIIATRDGYYLVTFEPNADNIGVVIMTICTEGPFYRSVNYLPLEDSGDTELLVRRDPHTGSTRCTLYVDVMRATWDEKKSEYMNPDHDYVGESLEVVEEKVQKEKL